MKVILRSYNGKRGPFWFLSVADERSIERAKRLEERVGPRDVSAPSYFIAEIKNLPAIDDNGKLNVQKCTQMGNCIPVGTALEDSAANTAVNRCILCGGCGWCLDCLRIERSGLEIGKE